MSDSDNELLFWAAKAIGAKRTDYSDKTTDHWVLQHSDGVWRKWNPREDDGDSRRLQAALEIDILYRRVGGERVEAVAPSQQVKVEYCNPSTREAATRSAVLKAAASIGRSKK